MPVAREQLKARLTELTTQAETLKQQLFATLGAIADIEYWLDTDAKPIVEKE